MLLQAQLSHPNIRISAASEYFSCLSNLCNPLRHIELPYCPEKGEEKGVVKRKHRKLSLCIIKLGRQESAASIMQTKEMGGESRP